MRKIFQEFSLWYNTFDIVLISLILIFAYITLLWIKKSKSNLPPGPVGLPIVGYVPFMKKHAHIHFSELGRKYGDVFSLQLGSQFVVVLNSADAIKEGYTKPGFHGRPKNTAFEVSKKIGPFFRSENHIWSEHRKVFIHTLKDLGYGKSRLEAQIRNEVASFLAVLRSYDGRPIDPQIPLTPSIANVISALLFNETFDYKHPERIALDENLQLATEVLAQTATRIFFPWLRYLPFLLKRKTFRRAILATQQNDLIYRKKIEQHKDTLDPENIRDYIDTYLVEMKSRKEKNKETTLSEGALLGSISELQGAGSETTRNTLLWCIYVLAAYPDVQQRVQEEIAGRLGTDKRPDYEDIKMMPYAHAVIMEVMRWKTLGPISVLRCTTEDTSLRGYNIPKETILMANLWNAHNDAKVWSDPDVFAPERFLSEDGLCVRKSPNLILFSVGKRVCPGEQMANIEIFLYLVSMLQSFDVSFPQGVTPTFEGELGITYKPRAYVAHFRPKK